MEVAEPQQPDPENNNPTPRRVSRRSALTEITEPPNAAQTPKSTSPDEQIIIQRGPRRKPLTWSPYEYNRSKILGPPRDKTPEKIGSAKPDINLKLRRRLIMTTVDKNQGFSGGESIARRLRSVTKAREEILEKE